MKVLRAFCRANWKGNMKLRPYQSETIEAINHYLASEKGNPCAVLPTGAGKSLVIAELIKGWKGKYAPLKVCILAHRSELVQQNSDELSGISEYKIGLYSAKLKRRDYEDILFASIDSIYKKWNEFNFDVLIIDEAHRIPVKGEGKYLKFIEGCKKINPKLRVVGLTATPYRLGSGPICHEEFILNKVVYEANVGDLIRDGYLCPIRSKVTAELDLSSIKKTASDYNQKQLEQFMNVEDDVRDSVNDMLEILIKEKRKSIIIFCTGINHANTVSRMIEAAGYRAPVITGKTKDDDRARLIGEFKDRKYQILVSVNVFLEGFNVKHIDCVVMMRPTKSKALWIQAVGRGLRLHDSKTDCLVLDYGNNIMEHGPIDQMDEGFVRIQVCDDCRRAFVYVKKVCPDCGWEIPKKEVERIESEEKVRREIERRASELNILGKNNKYWLKVDNVFALRHRKAGQLDSIKVSYLCGVQRVNEWICLDHPGYARTKALKWMADRGVLHMSVDEALSDMFFGQFILSKTDSILVEKQGKYLTIVDHRLKAGKETYA